MIFKITSTLEIHTGYEIPWSPLRILPFSVSSGYHNHHHTDNDGNYAQYFVIWDFIMNTNTNYLKNRIFKENEKKLK